ncbi:hypothetical protein HYPSUDRAFT_69071 [Hypholoma sublateritium FD-334 SS-4]|uniref:C2H2-type domain-containing protein n=1 Tax=Hypholoma sublateritium (strain FD-334 SS-4) TaxID=945553 RepID=A0A0D2NT45_HYPSF|nr:hypothetical protein HYPSUDRAFT_69071 [Hypholoma sublateritium FD-334 SS-4]
MSFSTETEGQDLNEQKYYQIANENALHLPGSYPLAGPAHTPASDSDNRVPWASAAGLANEESPHGYGVRFEALGTYQAVPGADYGGMQINMGIAHGEQDNYPAPGEIIGPDSVHIAGSYNHGVNAEINSHTSTAQWPVNAAHSSRASVAHRRNVKAPRTKPIVFTCPNASCRKIFTTAYHRRTHFNRYHIATELQERFACDIGICEYSTCYASDLPRHQRNCMARQLANFASNSNFSG